MIRISDEKLAAIRQALEKRTQLEQALFAEPPTPSVPTSFWCGTREKLDVMRLRAELGESIFHPADETKCKPSFGDGRRQRFDDADKREMRIDGDEWFE